MITKDEIEIKAQELEVHSSNVQRKHVYGWVLSVGLQYVISDFSCPRPRLLPKDCIMSN